jgi:hypothetical protein
VSRLPSRCARSGLDGPPACCLQPVTTGVRRRAAQTSRKGRSWPTCNSSPPRGGWRGTATRRLTISVTACSARCGCQACKTSSPVRDLLPRRNPGASTASTTSSTAFQGAAGYHGPFSATNRGQVIWRSGRSRRLATCTREDSSGAPEEDYGRSPPVSGDTPSTSIWSARSPSVTGSMAQE